ncbi:MAG: glycosyltransferase family 4 protein, partial [Flavisolibacter sp.]|nr:glycosyltransferase family 4 protein [Flavisolibacter sp.]
SYTGAAEKIRVVYSAVKEGFQPTPYTEQESTREKYTGGKQYFIYVGALQPRKNLLNLLKGFSVFKNRLKSEMKLVLCGRMAWKNEELVKMLKTYKFRHDVLLTGYVSEKELVTLLGSAYAMVYPSFFEGFGVPVLEAMHCNVPALTSSGTSMEEIGADAALYFNPRDHKDIGDKMMMIYKDENLRSRLIENGKKTAAGYSWQKTADLLWLSVMDASIKK